LASFLIPFFLIFIGWLNITTHISFGEKGKIIYVIFLLVAPLGPIFGIIGIMNPNYIISITVSIIFLFIFIGLFIYILYGFVVKYKTSKNTTSNQK
jgi:hypothetical protein